MHDESADVALPAEPTAGGLDLASARALKAERDRRQEVGQRVYSTVLPSIRKGFLKPEKVAASDLLDCVEWIEDENASRKSNNAKLEKKDKERPIDDGPQVHEVVRALHPRLICTSGRRTEKEWFDLDAATRTWRAVGDV